MERARKREDKQARRNAILQAARVELTAVRFQALQMAQVARRAGLAKGTLYLYFDTKEALALALCEELLGGWFDGLDAAIDGARRLPPRRLAELMIEGMLRRPPLGALLGVLQATLEHNVPLAGARRFQQMLLVRVAGTGGRLERHLGARAGSGARALLVAHALVVGLGGMADPAPVIAEVRSDPALRALRVELRSEFVDAMEAILIQHSKKGRAR
jgi:AcrR family transcriptional regulator